MDLDLLFSDKTIKAKAKVAQLGEWLLNRTLTPEVLMLFADGQKPVNKATCIEAFEYATKQQPGIADHSTLVYMIRSLSETEPRIKWESAKVIGNIAGQFTSELSEAIAPLLENAAHSGTVVRWAAAYALSEILKLKTNLGTGLLPQIATLSEKEADNGVKKKYLDALKKLQK